MGIQSRKKMERLADIFSFSAVVLLALLVLFPLWWMFRSSLMTNPEIGSLRFFPSRWLVQNYPEALEVFEYFKYLGNTMSILIPCVVFGTITAILCGYSFARLYFRGRAFVFGLCIASLLLPSIVTLIPLYVGWVRFLGLGSTYWPLILPYLTGGGAFNIFLVRQFIMTIPKELDEAAKIDGAGSLRILVQILLPSIIPAVIVVALFIFIGVWNDVLLQTVYISNSEQYTIALGLRRFNGSYGTDWKLAMASTVLSILPGVLVYLVGQKYFVEGIVMTGLKS
ncbi:MAG: carbohydrate ABC transporter permease [Clostridiales bacterium]|jgi:multiple sugar transport system permease protein|nr:carbohydrate ABC transporter permease [Clostridiales bacterium]